MIPHPPRDIKEYMISEEIDAFYVEQLQFGRNADAQVNEKVPCMANLDVVPRDVWKISRATNENGHPISTLITVSPGALRFTKTPDYEDPVRLQADIDLYSQWTKEGKAPPPIECVENPQEPGTFLVTQGRRRAEAALKAGVSALRAWVSPVEPRIETGEQPRPISYESALGVRVDENTLTQSELTPASWYRENLRERILSGSWASANLRALIQATFDRKRAQKILREIQFAESPESLMEAIAVPVIGRGLFRDIDSETIRTNLGNACTHLAVELLNEFIAECRNHPTWTTAPESIASSKLRIDNLTSWKTNLKFRTAQPVAKPETTKRVRMGKSTYVPVTNEHDFKPWEETDLGSAPQKIEQIDLFGADTNQSPQANHEEPLGMAIDELEARIAAMPKVVKSKGVDESFSPA